jgi:putative ABC transport system permease protein
LVIHGTNTFARRWRRIGGHFACAATEIRDDPGRYAFVTIGVVVGVVCLVSIGSLAWRLHRIVQSAEAGPRGLVQVAVSPELLIRDRSDDLLRQTAESIGRLPGVDRVVPRIVLPFTLGAGVPAASAREAIVGTSDPRLAGTGNAAHAIPAAIIGADFAEIENVRAGDLLSLYGTEFLVIGVSEKRFAADDQSVFVAASQARHLVPQVLPARGPARTAVREPFTVLDVYADRPERVNEILNAVNSIPNVTAHDPRDDLRETANAFALLEVVAIGIAGIVFFSSAAAIGNAMLSSVAERRKEIAIRRAVGATRRDVISEVCFIALILALASAACGVAISEAIAAAIRVVEHRAGIGDVFSPTPVALIASLCIILAASMVASFVPARRAARVEPATAMRAL